MDVAELTRKVEYKEAPVPLLAIQALANTYSFEDDEELLLDSESARQWLIRSDLAVPDVTVDREALERLRSFRGTVRALIDANLNGGPGDPVEAELADLVVAHPVRLATGEGGELSLDLAPAASVGELISQMLGIILQAQHDGTWPRLKICASDECRWAFFDASRNRGGTWCQMEVCGNRAKNRRYRRRSAEHPTEHTAAG